MCSIPGCQEHYGCRLSSKGIQVSPTATPSRVRNPVPVPHEPPSFNKQIMYEDRPGGTKIPLLNASGDVIRRKQYGENRHRYEAIRRQRHNANHT